MPDGYQAAASLALFSGGIVVTAAFTWVRAVMSGRRLDATADRERAEKQTDREVARARWEGGVDASLETIGAGLTHQGALLQRMNEKLDALPCRDCGDTGRRMTGGG